MKEYTWKKGTRAVVLRGPYIFEGTCIFANFLAYEITMIGYMIMSTSHLRFLIFRCFGH